MARTDAATIAEYANINSITGTTINLAPWISSASLLIDRVETCATEKGMALTEEELKNLETFLTIHTVVLANTKGRIKSEKNMSASSTYVTDSKAKGLSLTSWGQLALNSDPSGCLAKLTERKSKVVGMRSGINCSPKTAR